MCLLQPPTLTKSHFKHANTQTPLLLTIEIIRHAFFKVMESDLRWGIFSKIMGRSRSPDYLPSSLRQTVYNMKSFQGIGVYLTKFFGYPIRLDTSARYTYPSTLVRFCIKKLPTQSNNRMQESNTNQKRPPR